MFLDLFLKKIKKKTFSKKVLLYKKKNDILSLIHLMRFTMKHLFYLLLLGLFTTACSSDLQENREMRSTIYSGQSTWDMYENFGAPTYAVRVSPNEVHFVYRREEVTRDWTKMYFDWCDMVVMTVDDYVVDWDLAGNQCYLNVAESVPLPDGENERQNALRQYIDIQDEENTDFEYKDEFDDSDETLF